MTLTFRFSVFAGIAAATFCLASAASNQASAQHIRIGGTTFGFYSPYHGQYDPTYYGGQRNGYTGYGQGPYGYGSSRTYLYQRSPGFRHGTNFRGGFIPQRRAYNSTYYYGSGPSYYSPYGYFGGY